jgi:UrcA family protein
MTFKQACLIAAALAVGAGAAGAQPVRVSTDLEGAKVVHVRTADLNLSEDSAAREMWGRIKEAARDVCGQSPVLNDLQEMTAYRQCMTGTEVDTVQRLGSSKVAAVSHLDRKLLYAAR